MRNSQSFNITLTNEIAALVQEKIASGEYANESAVITEGLLALKARDKAFEQWLHHDVTKSYDAFMANPESGIPAEDVMAHIEARYKERQKKSDNSA